MKQPRKRILIVDNEPAILESFTRVLLDEMPDLEVDTVLDGARAVEMFNVGRHDVIILDISMPVLDGVKTFHELEIMCENRGWDMPAIIFCTGYLPPEGVQEIARENSNNSLLLKPVPNKVLVEAVREMLSVEELLTVELATA
jgi:CheY-like chemotaxis protein